MDGTKVQHLINEENVSKLFILYFVVIEYIILYNMMISKFQIFTK